MKPGIYFDLPNADYHGGPGVSKSQLDLLNKSPLHYRAAMDAREKGDLPEKRHYIIGDSFHKLVLEPGTLEEHYAIGFDKDAHPNALDTIDDLKKVLVEHGEKVSGTKKELIDRVLSVKPDAEILQNLQAAYDAKIDGKTVLLAEDYDKTIDMIQAVRRHPAAAALLSGEGVAEASVYWTDKVTGQLTRCRPDFWRKDGIIVDVKTTDDASPEEFARSVAKWRYHVQDAMYLDGLTEAYNAGHFPDGWAAPKAFAFLVVEKKSPHAVGVYILDNESKSLGFGEYRKNMQTFADCIATGEWKAYGDEIQQIGLPNWYLYKNAA